jgi:hypothetical membrane protein
MTHGEFDLFLVGTILTCCVMCVFNAIKNAHRGWAGLILSVAFLVFAGTLYLYHAGAPPLVVDGSCGVLFLLLAWDFLMRAGKPTKGKKR